MTTPNFAPEVIRKAAEMRAQQIPYKLIARELNCDDIAIGYAVRNARKYGTLDRFMNGEKRRRRSSTISKKEIVLAYELHQNGCTWDNIGIGLGFSGRHLKRCVAQAMREGLPS